jgi:hypothetical protein
MKIGQNESLACRKCPVGANCSTIGVTLRELPLLPGYWRWRRDVADVKRCPGYSHGSANTTGCAGHVTGAGEDEFGNDYCKGKLKGPYCSVCDPELALVSETSYYYNNAIYACEVCTATYQDVSRVVSWGLLGIVILALLINSCMRCLRARSWHTRPVACGVQAAAAPASAGRSKYDGGTRRGGEVDSEDSGDLGDC